MTANHLKLNAEKTIFLPISRKKKKVDPLQLNDNTEIPPSEEARNLGVMMNSNMNMGGQVLSTKRACLYQLRNIAQLKEIIPGNVLPSFIYAYVTSRLDFCNSLLIGATQKEIHQLQIIQNSCARLLTNTPKTQSITLQLQRLHWLPIKQRIIFKLLTMAHKLIYDNTYPKYTRLTVKEPSRNTRSSNFIQLESQYRVRLSTVGCRAVYQNIVKLWNELPGQIRSEQTLVRFRSLVKTYLFKQAFN
jgi:hypothetical protein